MINRSALCITLFFSLSCFAGPSQYSYRVIAQYPHDTTAFTQGLVYADNTLYESTGHYGHSRVIARPLGVIEPRHTHPLADHYFGEGLTLLNNRLYQLSWREQRGFIYRPHDLKLIGSFDYRGEGWGLTHNGRQLILSHGTDQLSFIDPGSFEVSHRLKVTRQGRPVRLLNELEWVEGLIYANIWLSNDIVMIDPQSGEVVGTVDLTKLVPRNLQHSSSNVLNGIAYDQKQRRLLVTGKRWPQLFHIELEKILEP